MITAQIVPSLQDHPTGDFADKPTTLTPGQKEASDRFWVSANGQTQIGVWECEPGRFTADRSGMGEYCHIISGRASIFNADGTLAGEIGPGDLLILPRGWKGEWLIHEHLRKLFIIDAGS